MTAFPIWFGSEERQLFGWVHLPERAVAGIVLCPPIGIEGSPGYRGLTILAERLTSAGFVVLRFDYTGTGDSGCDTSDVTTVETWAEDIESAIKLVRSTGISNIGLIGLRVGALLAGHVAPRILVDALVLWDPCITGRRYLREQEILGAVVWGEAGVTSPRTTDEIDIPSIHLPRDLANTLANLDLGSESGKLPDEVLVLTRPDRPTGTAMRERLSAVHTEWTEAPEQHIFFESGTPFMPNRTIDHIADWCIRVFNAPTSPGTVPQCPPHAWSSTVLAGPAGKNPVVERPVTIEPGGLFGLLSEPPDLETPRGHGASPLSILLLNLGGDRRTGPSRLWVDLGRSWARQGVRVLRLDLSGLGDSPPRPGVERYLVYSPEGINDVTTAARFLAPDDPSSVVIMGVCSGAYHAAEAAMILKSNAVWLLNPAVPVVSTFPVTKDSNSETPQRRVVRRADPISQRFSRMTGPVNVAHSLMPDAAWWLLDRLGLYTYPIRAFDLLLEQGTDIFLMCGKAESVPYIDRGHRALRDRLGSGRLHPEVVNALDHGLMMSASRHEVTRRLNDYVAKQLVDIGNKIHVQHIPDD